MIEQHPQDRERAEAVYCGRSIVVRHSVLRGRRWAKSGPGVAAERLIGERFFLNVPWRFAAVRASGCSVPARRQAVMPME
jgi:hypothetical protein